MSKLEFQLRHQEATIATEAAYQYHKENEKRFGAKILRNPSSKSIKNVSGLERQQIF